MEQRYKHPRIFHLPWSQGLGNDDRFIPNLETLKKERVVVLDKLDGENCTFYRDGFHFRSLDSNTARHNSQAWAARYWAEMAHNIPEGVRVCGEYLYAKHSIHYHKLPGYFLVHSIWFGEFSWAWDLTKIKAREWGFLTVPQLYAGDFSEVGLKKFQTTENSFGDEREGYVVRVYSGINLKNYKYSVAKWVRAGHVQTDQHWSKLPLVKNKLELERK
jgi:hypothetical protein